MLPITTTLVPTVSRFLNDDWNNLLEWTDRHITHTLSTSPPVNSQATPDSIIIEMAVPGMKKSDFDIQLNQNEIIIKVQSSTSTAHTQSDVTTLKREYDYSAFRRSFAFEDSSIDTESIGAFYQNGILRITLPKKESSKVQNKNIEIK